MDEELLDVFDANYCKIGVASRGVAHREGLWHHTFHCWVVREDSVGRGEVLVQERSSAVVNFPGMFDISVAGHVSAGENILDAGLRELEEELGLVVDGESLISAGVNIEMFDGVGVKNREFCHTYLLDATTAGVREDETFSGLDGEVSSAVWLPLGRLGEVGVEEGFVPHQPPHYYLRVASLAQRYFRGDVSLFL